MTTEQIIEVVQAHRDKKPIDYRTRNLADARWHPIENPSWNFDVYEYRIRPNIYPAIFAIRLPNGATITPYFVEADALAHAKSAPGSTVLKYNLDEDYRT